MFYHSFFVSVGYIQFMSVCLVNIHKAIQDECFSLNVKRRCSLWWNETLYLQIHLRAKLNILALQEIKVNLNQESAFKCKTKNVISIIHRAENKTGYIMHAVMLQQRTTVWRIWHMAAAGTVSPTMSLLFDFWWQWNW